LENKNSKKLSTKNEKIFGVYTREWKKGDFIKVMSYDMQGEPNPFYAFIICEVHEHDTQIQIFPRYKIYSLDMKREEEVDASSMQLISSIE